MTTLVPPTNINTILNDFSYKVVLKEYDNLYAKYKLYTTDKQITNNYADIDQLINNINNPSPSSQKIRERKCYPTSSNLVYATKELHDLIMNPKFCNYLHTHGSHDMSKPFDARVLATGLKYFNLHLIDKKTTNPILLNELNEIQNSFRIYKKDLIDTFIKKWTIKDRDIKINL